MVIRRSGTRELYTEDGEKWQDFSCPDKSEAKIRTTGAFLLDFVPRLGRIIHATLSCPAALSAMFSGFLLAFSRAILLRFPSTPTPFPS